MVLPIIQHSLGLPLNTSSNGVKVSFIQICFRSLLSLIQETSLLSECICEAMLDSFVICRIKPFDSTERFVLVLFQVIIQSTVILLSVTNTPNRQDVVRTFRKNFSSFQSLRGKFIRELCFSFSALFLVNTHFERLMKALFARK